MSDARETVRVALQNVVNNPTAADAQAILSALAEAGMAVSDKAPSFFVILDLARRHMDALRNKDEPLRARLYDCIEVLREQYPESDALIEEMYGDRAAQEKTNG